MKEIGPGELIDGRYRVISRLGTGGMADVFLAEDEQLSRQVALKLLHRRFAEDPGFVERFRREAQSAASLQHPNVVSVFDRGAFDGTYYIAMEYLEGRSLKQLIREEAPLEPLRAIELTVQILKAARFAHRRGVIHRDLKPHNVIIDAGDHAKVTDFGIARAGASDMTETGSIMGTAQYLSPEQAQGHAVSAPSDLYSIGIVLYEMLTARVPFDGDSAVTIALKHVSEGPIPPSQINPAVPPGLEQVVMWSLNKNPGDRPADADEFIAALEQVRESLLIGGIGEVTASMAIVPATGAAVAGEPPATTLLPEVLTAYPVAGQATNGGDPSDGEGNGQHDSSGGGLWPWLAGFLVLLLIAGGVTAYLLTRPSKVPVPIVVKLMQAAATTKITNAGFVPNVISEQSPDAIGTVIDQTPVGGALVNKGTLVTLTVSSGPGTVNIPTIVQLPKQEAIKELKNAGLMVPRILQAHSATVPPGQAIRTNPPAGASLEVGSAVTLYVSLGPAPVRVPSVIGEQLAAARPVLTASGLRVHAVRQPSSTASRGTVIDQDPNPNSPAQPGSIVTLTVASAPATVMVPSVTGDTARGAVDTLFAQGLHPVIENQPVTSANEGGIVLSQDPDAGTEVERNADVTIVVGRLHASTTGTNTTPTTQTGFGTTPTTSTHASNPAAHPGGPFRPAPNGGASNSSKLTPPGKNHNPAGSATKSNPKASGKSGPKHPAKPVTKPKPKPKPASTTPATPTTPTTPATPTTPVPTTPVTPTTPAPTTPAPATPAA